MEAEKHKCVDCGFLGIRNLTTGQVDEAHESFRKSGDTNVPGSDAFREFLPLCAEWVVNFADEADEQKHPEILAAIHKERPCDKFVVRQIGSNPKEHRQIEMDKFLRDEAAQRAKEQRDWQSVESEKARVSQQDQKNDERNYQTRVKRHDRIFQFGMVVFSIVFSLGVGWLMRGASEHAATEPKQRPSQSAPEKPVDAPKTATQ